MKQRKIKVEHSELLFFSPAKHTESIFILFFPVVKG